jgi:hypothetical protein
MPIRERIKLSSVKMEALEGEVNNFLANSEEIDDFGRREDYRYRE